MRLFNRPTRIVIALIAAAVGFFVALKAKETERLNIQSPQQSQETKADAAR